MISDVGPGTHSWCQNLHRVNLMNNVKGTVPKDRLEVSNMEASCLLSNNTFKCDCPLECTVSTSITVTCPSAGDIIIHKSSPHSVHGLSEGLSLTEVTGENLLCQRTQQFFKLCIVCHPIEKKNLEGSNISDVGPGTFSCFQNRHRVNLMNNMRKTVPTAPTAPTEPKQKKEVESNKNVKKDNKSEVKNTFPPHPKEDDTESNIEKSNMEASCLLSDNTFKRDGPHEAPTAPTDPKQKNEVE